MAVEMGQVFGSGGSPSATVAGIGSQQVVLTTDWAPFAAVISVPSVTGKTLGTAGNDHTALILWSSAGADWSARAAGLGLQTIEVELWGVHIRVGTFDASAALDYVQPNLADEFLRCQRYYFSKIGVYGGAYGSGAIRMGSVDYPTVMRASPALSFGTPSYGNASGLTIQANTAAGFGYFATITSLGGASVDFNITADAEL
jgi:hypothetical protein